MKVCPNCNTRSEDPYCHQCGRQTMDETASGSSGSSVKIGDIGRVQGDLNIDQNRPQSKEPLPPESESSAALSHASDILAGISNAAASKGSSGNIQLGDAGRIGDVNIDQKNIYIINAPVVAAQAATECRQPDGKAFMILVGTRSIVYGFKPDSRNIHERSVHVFALEPAGTPYRVRSLTPSCINGRPVILVGVSSGIQILDLTKGSITDIYNMPVKIQNEYGFNMSAIVGNKIYASHSELGVCFWELESESPGQPLLPDKLKGKSHNRAIQKISDSELAVIRDDAICVVDISRRSPAITETYRTPSRKNMVGFVMRDKSIFGLTMQGAELWRWIRGLPMSGEKIAAYAAKGYSLDSVKLSDGEYLIVGAQLDHVLFISMERLKHHILFTNADMEMRFAIASRDYVFASSRSCRCLCIWDILTVDKPIAQIDIEAACKGPIRALAVVHN